MADIKFTKDHEWVKLEGGVATIGITEHAQNALGDVVFVELPEAGREVAAEEAIAVVESVKAASDVYAPIAGKIVEANQTLVDDPSLANSAPTTDGWFFKIEPSDAGAIDALMSEEEYSKFVDSL
ncbi:glycine cleavage system protein GcvH [Pseudoroseomonas ludipueritiae]|uniref:Glycine cleavage system H protein n=1 Tax=Pseudoroseomonas ludipueritiae TaxID=198093 RepID=A0ABR7R869_9PROT|nr:glycine cleavage system protein GcvH [Pseudoroseomonas ludipueritiae]MBC9177867.1 glycine cleavage system protein GcvH [Pseudoroseomonas ludipueritiae]MCG7361310.1 glycine cleavage system protein GcvH [Roseomonas sp. ACRSG]